MKPAGFFADSSSTGLTKLRSWSGTKKKVQVESVYACDLSYKKSKKSGVTGVVVNSLTGPLLEHVLQTDCSECKMSWGSEVKSENVSISGVLDIENMDNIVAEKTSYIDSNTSKTDDMVDDMTPRKMQTRIYVLEPLLKTPSFKNLSDNNTELVLSKFKFVGSNQLPLAKLYVPDRHSFEPVKLFALDMELAAVPEKTNGNKLILIKKIFYRIDGFGEVSTLLKFPKIIKALFISEFSMNKAKELAICKKIIVNDDLRKINSHSN
ncbi:hypothetical protein G9A89_006360 [Geosiphon pyriformis]|nr:hypothetical protein G9A89_006360 [Geosiphon pyriformis]